jgi:hypothetical protein
MIRASLALLLAVGCGGDDAPTTPNCSIAVTGDVTATDSCRPRLCYQTSNDYQSLEIASPELGAAAPDLSWAIVVEEPIALAFGGGQTLTIDQMRPTSQLRIDANAKTYAARVAPQSGQRDAAETATVVLEQVQPPEGKDLCSGWATGTFDLSLVEITGLGTSTETVGPGRAQVHVSLAF